MAGIEVTGMDALLQKLESMATKSSNVIVKNALIKAANPILEEAKTTSSFVDKSGKLRAGLKIGKIITKNGSKYIEIGISKGDISNIFYGKFIEYGTSKKSATPFLTPAFYNNRKEAYNIMKESIRKDLEL